MTAVFFEADHDAVTQRVHKARRKALAINPAYPELKLFGKDAMVLDVIIAYSMHQTFGLFSGMGHGDPDCFCGQHNADIFDKSNSKKINHTIAGAIVHLHSCDCAQVLGEELVKSWKAKAFIGYTTPVSVPSDQSVVDEFIKVSEAIDRSILNGDSHSTTKSKMLVAAQNVEASLQAPNSKATPRDLASFRLNQAALVGPWTNSKFGSY